jgi:hypothetical protein
MAENSLTAENADNGEVRISGVYNDQVIDQTLPSAETPYIIMFEPANLNASVVRDLTEIQHGMIPFMWVQ